MCMLGFMQYSIGSKARGADKPALLSATESYIVSRALSSEQNTMCKALPDLCTAYPQFSPNIAYGSVYTSCRNAMSFLLPCSL